jgi:hypothetical protein
MQNQQEINDQMGALRARLQEMYESRNRCLRLLHNCRVAHFSKADSGSFWDEVSDFIMKESDK